MESYCLVVFDDGVHQCVKPTNIKKSGEDVTVKWRNCSYKVKILCTANEAICRSMLYSLEHNVPFIGKYSFIMFIKFISV